MKLKDILHSVAKEHSIEPEALLGRRRTEPLVTIRQLVMYRMRMETDCTLAECGQVLGGRAPATIQHGFMKIAQLNSNNGVR